MKQFDELFSDDKIIGYLCKLRVKIAKQRNKKHLLHLFTNSKKFNYHLPVEIQSAYEEQFAKDFFPLFPPRKQWKQIGQSSRYKARVGEEPRKLSTVDKNLYGLIKTVRFYRLKHPNTPFVLKLNKFIEDVQTSIKDLDYKIEAPYTYPKPKDKKKATELKENENNICRPLSLFSLKDKLILSFTNNYFTRLFDNYFESCSLAFRATPHQVINHHTAIQRILQYKAKYQNENLWVAECDMQKFFDTVDHQVITRQFGVLINKVRHDRPHIELAYCTNIFFSYLKCYCFNHDVLPKNLDEAHWLEYKIPKGQYGWIQLEIERLEMYQDITKERVGIPQGGALSGLIANIVLDIADKKVVDHEQDIFYTRFCDDMIIMHPDKTVCEVKIKTYLETLAGCNLVVHPFTNELSKEREKQNPLLPKHTLKPFWKGKSKGPYQWGPIADTAFPWIGFVGYEIKFNGEVRVRKSSLLKELKKQKDVIKDIKGAIQEELKVSGGTITESAMRKLIGMSVSRVELWNYTTVVSEMCWKNGFQELNPNPHSIKQLKRLDKSRSKLYYDLLKEMDGLVISKKTKKKVKEDERELLNEEQDNRQIVKYDKPFSYYYHLSEK